MALRITVTTKQDGVYIISPSGLLDSLTYEDLEKRATQLITPSLRVLVLNMSEITYISSRGVGAVFTIKKMVESKGCSFIMTDLQPQIKEVFEIIKALPVMNVFQSETELDAYLAWMQRKELDKGKQEI